MGAPDPLGRFDPQALLCTDPDQDLHQVLRWFGSASGGLGDHVPGEPRRRTTANWVDFLERVDAW